MTIWVTADSHFGHANIIKLCGRPFASVEEMDARMEAEWNRVVGPKDVVFHLGDFAFRKASPASPLLERLHGTKALIKGNHDPKQDAKGWDAVHDYFEMQEHGQRIVMSHYAMEDWNGAFHGSVMLHGHSHGRARVMKNRLDVGVDSIGFAPITLEEAIKKAHGHD